MAGAPVVAAQLQAMRDELTRLGTANPSTAAVSAIGAYQADVTPAAFSVCEVGSDFSVQGGIFWLSGSQYAVIPSKLAADEVAMEDAWPAAVAGAGSALSDGDFVVLKVWMDNGALKCKYQAVSSLADCDLEEVSVSYDTGEES